MKAESSAHAHMAHVSVACDTRRMATSSLVSLSSVRSKSSALSP